MTDKRIAPCLANQTGLSPSGKMGEPQTLGASWEVLWAQGSRRAGLWKAQKYVTQTWAQTDILPLLWETQYGSGPSKWSAWTSQETTLTSSQEKCCVFTSAYFELEKKWNGGGAGARRRVCEGFHGTGPGLMALNSLLLHLSLSSVYSIVREKKKTTIQNAKTRLLKIMTGTGERKSL